MRATESILEVLLVEPCLVASNWRCFLYLWKKSRRIGYFIFSSLDWKVLWSLESAHPSAIKILLSSPRKKVQFSHLFKCFFSNWNDGCSFLRKEPKRRKNFHWGIMPNIFNPTKNIWTLWIWLAKKTGNPCGWCIGFLMPLFIYFLLSPLPSTNLPNKKYIL